MQPQKGKGKGTGKGKGYAKGGKGKGWGKSGNFYDGKGGKGMSAFDLWPEQIKSNNGQSFPLSHRLHGCRRSRRPDFTPSRDGTRLQTRGPLSIRASGRQKLSGPLHPSLELPQDPQLALCRSSGRRSVRVRVGLRPAL